MCAGAYCHRSSGCWVKMDIHCNSSEAQGDVVREEQGRVAMRDAETVVDGCYACLSTLQG